MIGLAETLLILFVGSFTCCFPLIGISVVLVLVYKKQKRQP